MVEWSNIPRPVFWKPVFDMEKVDSTEPKTETSDQEGMSITGPKVSHAYGR
jgi:hypothetical protein